MFKMEGKGSSMVALNTHPFEMEMETSWNTFRDLNESRCLNNFKVFLNSQLLKLIHLHFCPFYAKFAFISSSDDIAFVTQYFEVF